MIKKCGFVFAVALAALSSATWSIRPAAAEEVVIADFETGPDGFPSLWLSKDTGEHKVGAASGRIRLGPLPTRYKSQRTPGKALVYKPINDLHREVSSVQFWAKSNDIGSFDIQLLDGWAKARTFESQGFAADGQWRQVTLELGPDWRSPVTGISFEVTRQNRDKEENFLWIDGITATVGKELDKGLPLPTAKRLLDRPLFQPAGGKKGNDTRAYFPTLVKVPDWVPVEKRPAPNAKYYLYWAVHKGGYYIRMSWAGNLTGPYQEWNPGVGVLRNTDVGLPAGKGDFASPDVHILPETHTFRMFVHSDSTTYIAESADGLHWTGLKEPSGEYVKNDRYYYRVWKRGKDWYAIDRGGNLRHSADSIHFEKVKRLWWPASPAPRHVGVFPNPYDDDVLEVFASRVPTQDEHIELTRLDMSSPAPKEWHQTMGYVSILEPEREWEGSQMPSSISIASSEPPVRQLRDPYIYSENGKTYLIYCIQGEQGFGIAELIYPNYEPGGKR